jgi:hypothetical protein
MPSSSTEKLCVDIPRALNARVAFLAKLLGMSKAAFVAKLLDQGCAGYKADQGLRQATKEAPLPQESLPDSPGLRVKAS